MGNTAVTAAVGRRRGRPQRLPFDNTAVSSTAIDGNKRLAWLMAVSRLDACERTAANRSDFAADLRALDIRADSSRISRWESGLEPISPRLVRGYETVAGLAPHTIDTLRRRLVRLGHLRPVAARGWSPVAERSVDALLIEVAEERITGSGWLELADCVTTFEHIYLPEATWQLLVDRLLGELVRARGLAAARRYEAAAALIRHPAARAHMSRGVGRLVLAPGAQLITPALLLLAEAPDEGLRTLVQRLLASPTDSLRGAAEILAARLVSDGSLAPDSPELEAHVGYTLQHGHDRPRAAILELASLLPEAAFARVLSATKSRAAQQCLIRVRESSEVVEPDLARSISDHVAGVVEDATGRTAHDPDRMLRTVLRTALFHGRRERRHTATQLLLASPYAGQVNAAVLELTAHPDDQVAAQCWSLVARLAHANGADRLVQAVSAEERTPLRPRALVTLGAVRVPVPDDAAEALTRTAHEAPDTPAARAALFSLGLQGMKDRLRGLAATAPETQWWAGIGPAIHDN
ncbi:hypothetical protein E8D34_01255 [Nocardioides sp. GY 10113]|uniref:hypothetical protein n=1 Tax=Nocardioides sp. GY 10113 TaxID=2569761 RepID=UPI0010A8975F|nr:hypothetical protein [Nocardioides sp. GY 10113]TIC89156.1 hypothetical protein E8D34_01255 [Nocardioides sp. GY 10113]